MNILVAEDHSLYRKSIVDILKKMEIVDHIYEVGDGKECMSLLHSHHIDFVIMDFQMPEMHGVDCLRMIRQSGVKAKVLFLSQFGNSQMIMIIKRFGAIGFVEKHVTQEELSDIFHRTMVKGEQVWPENPSFEAKNLSNVSPLGGREVEVLTLIKEDFSNQEIAEILHIAPKTVENHRRSIIKKLNVRSIIGALKRFNLMIGRDF